MGLLTNPAGYSDNEWLEKRVCECVNEPMRLPLTAEPPGSLRRGQAQLARHGRGDGGTAVREHQVRISPVRLIFRLVLPFAV